MAAKKKPRKYDSAKRLALKIGLSLLIGTMTYLLTERFIGGDGPLAIMTSVFAGGVIFVAQFLIEVSSRIDNLAETQEKHLDAVAQKLHDDFKDLGHAAHLVQLLAKSSLSIESVAGLIQDASEVDGEPPELSSALTKSELLRLSTFVHKLRHEKAATYDGEDRDWLLGLAGAIKHSLKAISLATVDAGGHNLVDGGLWRSDLGIRYLDLQERAIKERGVRIQRIFISNFPVKPVEGTFQDIVSRQRDIGIDVRILNPGDLTGTAASKLEDFIIFDGELVYKTRAAAVTDPKDTPKILTSEICVTEAKIKESTEFFDTLWNHAKDFSDAQADSA